MATPIPLDPWNYSVEHVVKRLQTSSDLWSDRPHAVVPDLNALGNAFRYQDVYGSVLLTEIDRKTLKEIFNITTLGTQSSILHAIEKLRKESPQWLMLTADAHKPRTEVVDLVTPSKVKSTRPKTLTLPVKPLRLEPVGTAPEQNSGQLQDNTVSPSASATVGASIQSPLPLQKPTKPQKRARLVSSARPADDDDDSFEFIVAQPRPSGDRLIQSAKHSLVRRQLYKGSLHESKADSTEWDAILINNKAMDVNSDPGIPFKLGELSDDQDDLSCSTDTDSDTDTDMEEEKNKALSLQAIIETVDTYISTYRRRWEIRDLPKLQRSAPRLWKSSRGLHGKRTIVDRDDIQLRKYRGLLARLRNQIQSDTWTSVAALENICRSLEVTVSNIAEYEWRSEIYARMSCPERIPIFPSTTVNNAIQRSKKRGDDDSISIGSEDRLSDLEVFAQGENGVSGEHIDCSPPCEHNEPQSLSDSELYEIEHLTYIQVRDTQNNRTMLYKLLLEKKLEQRRQINDLIRESSGTRLAAQVTESLRASYSGFIEPGTNLPLFDMMRLYLSWTVCDDTFFHNPLNAVDVSRALTTALSKLSETFIPFLKILENALEDLNYYYATELEVDCEGRTGLVLVDNAIAGVMRDHQTEGVTFMWRETVMNNNPGCLLAHTMGLGKTMQTITLITALKFVSEVPRLLCQLPRALQRQSFIRVAIFCPAGLINNWLQEIEQWTPSKFKEGTVIVTVHDVSGKPYESPTLSTWQDQGGYLLISYDMLSRYMTHAKPVYQSIAESTDFAIADEAHKFKNEGTAVWKAMHGIATRHRVALTGSPLANSLNEYLSLLKWANPEQLAGVDVKKRFLDPVERGFNRANATDYEQDMAMTALYDFNLLTERKVQRRGENCLAANLPTKTYYLIKLRPLDSQMRIYEQLAQGRASSLRLLGLLNLMACCIFHLPTYLSELEDQGRRRAGRASAQASTQASEPSLMHRRLAFPSADPQDQVPMISPATTTFKAIEEDPEIEVARGEAGLSNEAEEEHVQFVRRICNEPGSDQPKNSPKPALIYKIVKSIVGLRQRVIIFSHWRTVLAELRKWLGPEFPGSIAVIDGNTPTSDRQDACRKLNCGLVSILLATTRAGALGLNMQGASNVIIVDFTFNPTWEQQAVARAWRMGQERPVKVYHLIMDGSYETQLFERTVRKKELALEVVDGVTTPQSAGAVSSLLAPTSLSPRQPLGPWVGKDKVLDQVIGDETLNRHLMSITEIDSRPASSGSGT